MIVKTKNVDCLYRWDVRWKLLAVGDQLSRSCNRTTVLISGVEMGMHIFFKVHNCNLQSEERTSVTTYLKLLKEILFCNCISVCLQSQLFFWQSATFKINIATQLHIRKSIVIFFSSPHFLKKRSTRTAIVGK